LAIIFTEDIGIAIANTSFTVFLTILVQACGLFFEVGMYRVSGCAGYPAIL
jgi:hypothetical protein